MTFIPAFSEAQSHSMAEAHLPVSPRSMRGRGPRGESGPSGKPHDLAAHEEDRSPSPVQQSLHISTTPTTRGRKR